MKQYIRKRRKPTRLQVAVTIGVIMFTTFPIWGLGIVALFNLIKK